MGSHVFRVATVLTACGIETQLLRKQYGISVRLQQCLPLAVLKQQVSPRIASLYPVATVLTACGIETRRARFF